MEVKKSKNFCVLPWVHQHISERGNFYPCAFSTEVGEPIRDQEGRILEAQNAMDRQKAWNSQQMREMRLSFLKGEKPKACSRCFRMENFSHQSLRQVSERRWGDLRESCVQNTAPDGSVLKKLLSLDLRFGNHCNLRCRMCSPESSLQLTEEYKKIFPASQDYYQSVKSFDWFKSQPLLEALLSSAEDLRELHFAGGEPFLIPEIKNFMKELIARGYASKITLSFNTNLTLLPKDLMELWPQFEKVKLIVSLDGVGRVNDYIRFPSRFEKIEENLFYLDRKMDTHARPLVCFNSTVQVYNIFSLGDLIDYVTDTFENFFPFPILSPLHWPEYLSIAALPEAKKNKAKNGLKTFLVKAKHKWKHLEHRCDYPNGAEIFENSILGLIQLMDQEDRSTYWDEFLRVSSQLDKERKQAAPLSIQYLSFSE